MQTNPETNLAVAVARISDFQARATRRRLIASVAGPSRWRRWAGAALVHLGEVLLGEERGRAQPSVQPLNLASATR